MNLGLYRAREVVETQQMQCQLSVTKVFVPEPMSLRSILQARVFDWTRARGTLAGYSVGDLAFCDRSCFILTNEGVIVAGTHGLSDAVIGPALPSIQAAR